MKKIISAPIGDSFQPAQPDNKFTKLRAYLQYNPLHCFSDTGIRNLAGRFGLSIEEVKHLITEFGALEGQKDV